LGKLDGRVGLITGSARGQGAAAARLFVQEGARVVVSDILDDLGETLAAELGSTATYSRLDVTDPAGWAAAVEATVAAFGKLDILVNNAGVNLTASIEETSVDDFMHIVGVNQLGTWLGVKSVLPEMQAAGGGSIVNIVSIGAMTSLVDKSAYLGSKWAVRGMTKCLASELGRYGIRVNAVHPGGIATSMTEGISSDAYEDLPVPRLGRPDEIARAVLFFASDDSAYCTGAELVVDGGKLAGAMGTPDQPATATLLR
jgi:3alpha(or 20beta)-hydroxysteroid dehydrogenase